MKTTIEIPDSLYPEIEAASAAAGQSVEAFVVNMVTRQLSRPTEIPSAPSGLTFAEEVAWRRKNTPPEARGWEAVFGSVDPEVVAEVQSVIDEEFSKIEPEDWE